VLHSDLAIPQIGELNKALIEKENKNFLIFPTYLTWCYPSRAVAAAGHGHVASINQGSTLQSYTMLR
jgi:hypothetical protein